MDKNKDGYIGPAELRVLVLGIRLEEEEALGSNTKDFVDKVMEAFDTSEDARIDEAEFVNAMVKYISDAGQSSKADKVPKGFNRFGRNAKVNQTKLSFMSQVIGIGNINYVFLLRLLSCFSNAKVSFFFFCQSASILLITKTEKSLRKPPYVPSPGKHFPRS